jgi:hypothetical protein
MPNWIRKSLFTKIKYPRIEVGVRCSHGLKDCIEKLFEKSNHKTWSLIQERWNTIKCEEDWVEGIIIE